MNMIRACRLVVDTGIHAFGWSKQKAVDYMLENTAFPKKQLEKGVNRYITWPGQACTYKIGELKIRELREKSSQQLGSRFDIKEFHRTVLKCAGPMSALETCINRWLEQS